MNKSDIVGRVAGRMGMSRATAERAIDTVLAAIAEALAREEAVRLCGFGTFATKSRAARTGRSPANRGGGGNPGLESAVVQGGPDAAGRREQGLGPGVLR